MHTHGFPGWGPAGRHLGRIVTSAAQGPREAARDSGKAMKQGNKVTLAEMPGGQLGTSDLRGWLIRREPSPRHPTDSKMAT